GLLYICLYVRYTYLSYRMLVPRDTSSIIWRATESVGKNSNFAQDKCFQRSVVGRKPHCFACLLSLSWVEQLMLRKRGRSNFAPCLALPLFPLTAQEWQNCFDEGLMQAAGNRDMAPVWNDPEIRARNSAIHFQRNLHGIEWIAI